jgi:hypothetical protein
MDIEASKGGQGQSVFRRPPPPRTPAPPSVARPVASSIPLAIGEAMTPVTIPSKTGDPELEAQCRRGAQWFYWIAALSLVNAVLGLAGQDWRFIIGLGVTQLFQEIAVEAGAVAHLIALAVIAFFGMLGQRAVAGKGWAFLTGMIVYGIDGLIFLLIQDWIGVGFHVLAIVMMFRGYVAARQLAA